LSGCSGRFSEKERKNELVAQAALTLERPAHRYLALTVFFVGFRN